MNTKIRSMIEVSKEHDSMKADYKGKATSFWFNEQSAITGKQSGALFGRVQVQEEIPAMLPTDWAYRQLYARLGPIVFGKGSTKSLPFDYLSALPSGVRASLLNEHLGKYKTGQMLVRGYSDQCRAILSGQYTEISNTELLQIVGKIMEEADMPSEVVNYSSVTPDTMNTRVIWQNVETNNPDGGGNREWGIGVALRNNEIGGGYTWVQPLIKRHSCNNSISVNLEKFSLRLMHKGGSSIGKMVQIKTAMQEALPFAAQLLERMIEADAQEVPNFSEVLRGLAIIHHWDDKTSLEVAKGTENRDTLAGIVNGITFAAHKIEDPDARMEMEITGGNLLLTDANSLFGRAIKLARKEEVEL